MAVTYNIKGTSHPNFAIGKSGPKIFTESSDPSGSYTVANADLWIDPSNYQLKIRAGGAWKQVGETVETLSASNLAITGDLTVSGTTTSINSTVLDVNDNKITLNKDWTASPTQDAGIVINRGSADDVELRFNETSDKWEFTNDGSTYYQLLTAPTGHLSFGASSAAFNVDVNFTNAPTFNIVNGSSSNVFTVAGSTGATTISGPTIINNTLNTNNNVTFSGDNVFNIQNSSNNNVFDIDVSNNATTIATALNVNNAVTIAGDNNFLIKNASNVSIFDIDVANNTTLIAGDTTVKNDFKIQNSSSVNVFDIDVTANTFEVDLDLTVNNATTIKNDLTIKNTSNNNVFNVDVSNTSFDIDLDLTVNNTAIIKNDFSVKNVAGNTTLFDIDVSNTNLNVDLDLTVNNSSTFNNSLTINNNAFAIKNVSNTNVFDVDVTNNVTALTTAMTVNNSVTFTDNSSNTFNINNSSNNSVFNIDMSTGATTIEGDVVFNDNRTQIKNSSNTTLFDIDIANVAVNIDMATTISNNVTFDNDLTFNINNSSSTNVFQVLGATGNTSIGGTLDVAGVFNLNNTTSSTSTGTGALIVDGGAGISENLNVGGNLTLTGDLIINGTTTTVNSTTVTVDDPIFTLGGDTAPGSDDSKDRGIEFRYYDSSAKLGFFGYDNSTSTFTFLTDATNSSEVFSGTAGNVTFGGITGTSLNTHTIPGGTGTLALTSDLPSAQTLTFSGSTLSISGGNSVTIDTLPSQTSHAGKFLTTDGTTATWGSAGSLPALDEAWGDITASADGSVDLGSIDGVTSIFEDLDIQQNITLSLAQNSASGSGSLTHNELTGILTFTPPDITGEVDTHLNVSGASSGQILSWNGSDYAWVADQTSTGNIDVVTDTTPQLGGNLDAQSNEITNVGKLEITNTTTDDSLLLTTTANSSTAAPVLTFKRNNSSPGDADYLGQIKFKGENDADQEVVYAKITSKILDATDSTEDGLIEFATRKAGSNTVTARLRSDSFQLLNGTGLTVAGDTTLSGTLNNHTLPGGAGTIALTTSFSRFHSSVQSVTSAQETTNSSSTVAYTFSELTNAVHYNVYLNRMLLRPTEFSVSGTTVTISSGVLAEDDELEVTGFTS